MLRGKGAHTDERKRDAEDREYQKLMGGYLPPGGGMTGNCHFLLLLLAFSEGFLSYNYYTTKVTHLKHTIQLFLMYSHTCPPSPLPNSRMFPPLGFVLYVCLWLNAPRYRSILFRKQQCEVVRRQTPEHTARPLPGPDPAPPRAGCMTSEKWCGCSKPVCPSAKWVSSRTPHRVRFVNACRVLRTVPDT